MPVLRARRESIGDLERVDGEYLINTIDTPSMA